MILKPNTKKYTYRITDTYLGNKITIILLLLCVIIFKIYSHALIKYVFVYMYLIKNLNKLILIIILL